MGHLLQVRRCFFTLNELPMNVSICTRILKDAQYGAGVRDGFECGRNVAGVDTRSVASVCECIEPKCSNRNWNPRRSVRVCLV